MPKGSPRWVGVYAGVWRQAMGGDPAWGPLAKFLRPLHELYGPEKVSRAFGIYLRDAGKYASVARFAQTVKLWLPTEEQTRCVKHPERAMHAIVSHRALCLECWRKDD